MISARNSAFRPLSKRKNIREDNVKRRAALVTERK